MSQEVATVLHRLKTLAVRSVPRGRDMKPFWSKAFWAKAFRSNPRGTWVLALGLCGALASGCASGGGANGGTGGSSGVGGSGSGGTSAMAGRGGSTAGSGGAVAGTGGVPGSGGTQAGGGGGQTPAGTGGTSAPDAQGSDRPAEVAPSSDGPAVGAKTYVYVSGFTPPIVTLEFDRAAGTLTRRSMVTSTPNDGEPSFIAFSPDKKYAYAIDEQMGKPLSRTIAYRIDQQTGALTEINRESTRTSVSAHVTVHKSGKWVLVSNYGGGSISVYPVRDDGGLGPSATPVPSGGQTHQVVWNSEGTTAFVPCLTARHLAIFKFDNGVLTPHNPPTIPINGGPRHIAFTPDEKYAYILTQGESTIIGFTHDKATSRLTMIDTFRSTDSGSLSAHIEVHQSGKFLYTTNRRDNSVGIFSIDAATGRLTRTALYREMLSAPRLFGIDSTGQYMIVASQNTGNVLLHKIDQMTGMLQRIGTPVAVGARGARAGPLARVAAA
ncbi:MAG TPA: lactonase family protein [Polyangia bacterium]